MLEVVLSLFVLSVGMVTIVEVLSQSLKYSYSTRDTIIATELAQEGVELMRNERDNDFVALHNGFTSFTDPHCHIDWNDGSLTCWSSQGANSRYYLQYVGGRYGHSNTTQERYSRYINIQLSGSGVDERARVRSFVFWGAFTIGSIPADGNPTNCSASTTCVYTEIFLTSWK